MLDLRTVYECNRCLGCKTLHPQVGIINLENPSLEEDAVKFEFYAVRAVVAAADGNTMITPMLPWCFSLPARSFV